MLTLADLWRGLAESLDPEMTMLCPVLVKKMADKVEFLAETAREVRGSPSLYMAVMGRTMSLRNGGLSDKEVPCVGPKLARSIADAGCPNPGVLA